MVKTRITEMFGVETPIVMGGMTGVGYGELVAAVANAGALGFITAHMFKTGKDLLDEIEKTKKLTNVRASGKDDALLLTTPIQVTLEYAVEFIADDELVEVTPQSIRMRKRVLQEHGRKRAARAEDAA